MTPRADVRHSRDGMRALDGTWARGLALDGMQARARELCPDANVRPNIQALAAQKKNSFR